MKKFGFLFVVLIFAGCASMSRSIQATASLKNAEQLYIYCENNSIQGEKINQAKALIESAKSLQGENREAGFSSKKKRRAAWERAELAQSLLHREISANQLASQKKEIALTKAALKKEQEKLALYEKILGELKEQRGGAQ